MKTGSWWSIVYYAGESVLGSFGGKWCVEFAERPGSMVVVERLRDRVLVVPCRGKQSWQERIGAGQSVR